MSLSKKLVHLFIPHESNNHKARILHSSSLLIISIFFIFFQLVLLALPKSGVRILGYASNIPTDQVIQLTNQKREEYGLPPLEDNLELDQAARAKGENMLANNYWAHVAPDGTEPWKFFKDAGYIYRYAGENLARDFSSANSAVDAWMASPTHRENMLSPKYKEIGVAVVEGDLAGVDTTIIVQFFGTKYSDVTPATLAENPNSQTEAKATLIPTATPAAQGAIVSTPSPTLAPTPIPPLLVQAPVAAEATESQQVLVSPFYTTKDISLVIVAILMLVLLVDAALVSRRRIVRIAGRSFAHISFLGMILAIAIILRAGKIL